MIIEARFNGPAGSGNGGYTAGLVAAALGADRSGAEVTLRVPPPLDTPLRITDTGEVYAGDTLIAETLILPSADPVPPSSLPSADPVPPSSLPSADPVPPSSLPSADGAPPSVTYEEAARAAAAYPGLVDHPFPTCYVCGPRRTAADGLQIFPGPLADGRTAAPWRVPEDVSTPTVWAALDCPGGWAVMLLSRTLRTGTQETGTPERRTQEAGTPERRTQGTYVLGRMAARVLQVPAPGTRCVVTAAVVATEGRKAQVRTAVYHSENPDHRHLSPSNPDHRRPPPSSEDPDHRRTPLAWAHATWIAI